MTGSIGCGGHADRERLLARIADIAGERFPGGQMSVPYRTRLRLARRRLSPRT